MAAVTIARVPEGVSGWIAPEVPTRMNVSAPSLMSSSTAMADEGHKGVERGGAVDEHEIVVGLDVRERFLELPDLADARVRAVEVDGTRAADEHVNRAGAASCPAARRDRLTHGALLGRGENIGDCEMAGNLNVHAGGGVGLGVEIDHERAQTAREGRRR